MRVLSWRLLVGAWQRLLARLRGGRVAAEALPPAGPPRVFIDALNLAYCTGNPPSLRVPLALLAQLLAEDRDAVLYFDASARYRLGAERALYERLLEHPRYCVEVASGKRADVVMLRAATACGGCVVSRDKYRDHRKKFRRLIDDPARLLMGGVREGRVQVPGLSVDAPLPASAEEAMAQLQRLPGPAAVHAPH